MSHGFAAPAGLAGTRAAVYRVLRLALAKPSPEQHAWLRSPEFRRGLELIGSQFDVSIPDGLKDVAFMLKDGKRFADTGGWGYALFDYSATADAFTPNGTGAACGAACHTIVKSKDFVFTAYGKR